MISTLASGDESSNVPLFLQIEVAVTEDKCSAEISFSVFYCFRSVGSRFVTVFTHKQKGDPFRPPVIKFQI